MGESIEYHILKTYDGSKCIIRVPTPDKDTFLNSVTTYSVSLKTENLQFTELNDQLLPDIVDGYFKIVSQSQFLNGVCGPSRFDWYKD
ncbi:unnamed protein product [Ambrosiozyma monospora]|uniref:Unnamed protein product n=1 Tax=Ambrosiozyma monospora TaxID=43982 RepID=A0ACB5U0E6_AMBMO|nr:unnamed protein product [Ambrosiozyma monospora]